MSFEYDPIKSQSNKEKYGIDFVEAQALWSDDARLEAPIFRPGEPRFLLVGTIDGVQWTAIITYRDDTVRIIFVRRARKEEVQHCEHKRNLS